jgi:hypothetical protein
MDWRSRNKIGKRRRVARKRCRKGVQKIEEGGRGEQGKNGEKKCRKQRTEEEERKEGVDWRKLGKIWKRRG